jgi:6-phosphogluconolactonase
MKSKYQNIFQIKEDEFNDFSSNFIKQKLEKLYNKKVLNIVLSGGKTPLPVLDKLKETNLDWSKFNFFLADERLVNINSDESNYKNINNVFFKYISSKNYPFLQEKVSFNTMILNYKKHIQNNVCFIKPNNPNFDMVILGMGEDGHTASLFPETNALKVIDDYVVMNNVPQLKSKRMTLTFPALKSCGEIIVLIKGHNKKKIFEDIISGKGEKYPIAKLLGTNINWIVGE